MNNINVYELKTMYDSRASFYGKAHIIVNNGVTTLRSYSTDVAYIKDGKAHVNGTHSTTTLRHIKEFLKQHNFKADSGRQIMQDYGVEHENQR